MKNINTLVSLALFTAIGFFGVFYSLSGCSKKSSTSSGGGAVAISTDAAGGAVYWAGSYFNSFYTPGACANNTTSTPITCGLGVSGGTGTVQIIINTPCTLASGSVGVVMNNCQIPPTNVSPYTILMNGTATLTWNSQSVSFQASSPVSFTVLKAGAQSYVQDAAFSATQSGGNNQTISGTIGGNPFTTTGYTPPTSGGGGGGGGGDGVCLTNYSCNGTQGTGVFPGTCSAASSTLQSYFCNNGTCSGGCTYGSCSSTGCSCNSSNSSCACSSGPCS